MKKTVALLMTLALLATGLAAAEAAPASMNITFTENPTTGYTWSWAVESPTMETPVDLVDNGYTAAPNPGELEGTGGTHGWTLNGKAEGDATVIFFLSQQWDGGEMADTITYTVHVAADLGVTVTDVKGYPDKYDPMKGVALLNENPTTGYSWAYKASAEGILKLDRDEFIAPESGEGVEAKTGEGGVHIWVFSGVAEGEVTLTFSYARSWEEGAKPDATVTYTFAVAKDLSVTLKEIGGDYSEYEPQSGTVKE